MSVTELQVASFQGARGCYCKRFLSVSFLILFGELIVVVQDLSMSLVVNESLSEILYITSFKSGKEAMNIDMFYGSVSRQGIVITRLITLQAPAMSLSCPYVSLNIARSLTDVAYLA